MPPTPHLQRKLAELVGYVHVLRSDGLPWSHRVDARAGTDPSPNGGRAMPIKSVHCSAPNAWLL